MHICPNCAMAIVVFLQTLMDYPIIGAVIRWVKSLFRKKECSCGDKPQDNLDPEQRGP